MFIGPLHGQAQQNSEVMKQMLWKQKINYHLHVQKELF